MMFLGFTLLALETDPRGSAVGLSVLTAVASPDDVMQTINFLFVTLTSCSDLRADRKTASTLHFLRPWCSDVLSMTVETVSDGLRTDLTN
jgi:hypothetical protein